MEHFGQQHYHMMVVGGTTDTPVHSAEGMGVVYLVNDILVLLDMESMIPRVVAGCSGMIPVDTRAFARKVVESRRCLRDSE